MSSTLLIVVLDRDNSARIDESLISLLDCIEPTALDIEIWVENGSCNSNQDVFEIYPLASQRVVSCESRVRVRFNFRPGRSLEELFELGRRSSKTWVWFFGDELAKPQLSKALERILLDEWPDKVGAFFFNFQVESENSGPTLTHISDHSGTDSESRAKAEALKQIGSACTFTSALVFRGDRLPTLEQLLRFEKYEIPAFVSLASCLSLSESVGMFYQPNIICRPNSNELLNERFQARPWENKYFDSFVDGVIRILVYFQPVPYRLSMNFERQVLIQGLKGLAVGVSCGRDSLAGKRFRILRRYLTWPLLWLPCICLLLSPSAGLRAVINLKRSFKRASL